MLHAQLEDRLRGALGAAATPEREESIRFAAGFAQMLVRVLPAGEVGDAARGAMAAAIAARATFTPVELGILLDLALAPDSRASITHDDLRAFGARFGPAEEEALRAAMAEEIDLSGFAERYGSAEALLLLDALFSVCGVDGVIDRAEIGRLTRAATELGIDPKLVGALFRKYDERHRAGELTFDLADRPAHTIGSSTGVDLHLPDPQVGERHARICRDAVGGWRIEDLESGRPTLLNGAPVHASPFVPGDALRIGSYTLTLDGDTLTARPPQGFSALSVRRLNRKIGDVSLLDDVSFTVFTGEVVAVVGPSGAGKTTLLSAITGSAPADSGDVILDGESFHAMLGLDPSLVGIVPQDDVVHAELTVEEALRFSAKLRLPHASPEDVGREVERVLGEMDIGHIRRSRVGDAVRRGISGGQRKRVNVGQELLTQSTRVLFLDEPTSGLDPNTAQEIVGLVRQLADDGRIVFLVTHDVSPSILAKVDHLLVLARGGRVAWFGPPDEATAWFGVRSADQIFARLGEVDAAEWGRRFREDAAFRKFVRTREHLLGLDGVAVASTRPRPPRTGAALRHYVTLTRRYARVKLRDRSGLAVLLAQAPFLGLAMWIVFPQPELSSLFMLALSSLWFGASAAVRELIADRTIWRRDARVGVGTVPYVASKLTILGMLAAVQCSVLAGMSWAMMGMGDFGYSLGGLVGVATLTGLVGVAMGLLLSALFSSSEAAVGMLPLLLIPQITFGGLLVKYREMGAVAKALSYLMVVRYGFDGLIRTGDELSRPGSYGVERERLGIEGFLYDLGFRMSADVDDQGIPLPALVGILVGWLVGLLAVVLGLVQRGRSRA